MKLNNMTNKFNLMNIICILSYSVSFQFASVSAFSIALLPPRALQTKFRKMGEPAIRAIAVE